ncbi:STAS domain-containing protein [Streptomyces microflavus]|uniref:STAS domain-containing protein n=1 Tax=Streptomyces microflavus TaxID=1919 RepID=UPI00364B236E
MNDEADSTRALLVVHATLPSAYVLTLRGRADLTTSEALEGDFARATESGLPLIVDLGALTFGNEELLGLLIGARRTCGVTLVGPLSPSFRQRLDTVGVTAWFTVRPTLTAALTTGRSSSADSSGSPFGGQEH